MANTIIEALKNYFCLCPLLGNGKINVDYLPAQGNREYSIDVVPGSTTLKSYTSGATIEKYLFVIRTNALYSCDVLQQMENSEIFELLKDWLAIQSKEGNLPLLPEGKNAQQIKAVGGGGYLISAGANVGTYQIQCVLTYYKEKE